MSDTVVEKQLVDVDFSGGINEDDAVEKVDWTKYLSTAENVVFNQSKKLSVRNGLTSFGSTDSDSNTFNPVYRLGSLDNGVGFVGKNFGLYQLNESRQNVDIKGQLSEFSVSSRQVGSANPGYAKSVALTDNYECILYQSQISNAGQHTLVIVDRKSGDIVRNYVYSNTASSNVSMVGVGSRYLHIYVYDTTASPKMFQVDTLNLPSISTGIGTSTVNLTSGGATSVIRGIISDSSTTSVVMYETAAGTTRFERFNTTPASTATGTLTLAGLANYDIDWNPTTSRYFVVGILSGAPNRYQLRELDTTFAATRTVTDTTAVTADLATDNIRVAVNTSTNEARVVAWSTLSTTFNATVQAKFPYCQIYSCTSAATTFTLLGFLNLWQELSLPFYNSTTGKFYIAAQKRVFSSTPLASGAGGNDLFTNFKFTTANTPSPFGVLVDITAAVGPANVAPRVFRPAAVLDNYVGNQNQYNATSGKFNGLIPQRPAQESSTGTIIIATTSRSLYSSLAIESCKLVVFDPSQTSFSTDVVSGGISSKYDGNRPQEVGFVDVPLASQTGSQALTVADGSGEAVHLFLPVYEFRDTTGKVHYSPCGTIGGAITTGLANNTFTYSAFACTVSSHQNAYGAGGINVAIFGPVSATSTTYLRSVATAQNGTISTAASELIFTVQQPTGSVVQFTAANPIMYRQPGTPSTALDRYPAIAFGHVIRSKERIFGCRGKTVYYSSFAVDGEQEWFNPSFSFPVNNGNGNIVGLATLDGTLVVFKRDSVFLVDGDGPPENGGSGNEFSAPRRISTEYGCIDQRSIVQVPNGVMYRSTRGIELLTRSGQIVWIGQTVATTVDNNLITTGSCFDRTFGRVYYCLASSEPSNHITGTVTGVVLCYDMTVNAWTAHKYTQTAGTGFAMQDIVHAKAASGSSADSERLFLSDGTVFYSENGTTLRDLGNTNINVRIDTGWVKAPQSMQDRLKVSGLYVLGNNQSPHNLAVSAAYDYAPTFTAVKTFTDSVTTPMVPEQVWVASPREELQAIRWRVETANPTSGTIGNGMQLDITGITVKFGIKGGGQKLAATSKG